VNGSSFGTPEDPTLAQVYARCVEAGFWVVVLDDRWRHVSFSEDLAAMNGEACPNEFLYSTKSVDAQLRAGLFPLEEYREQFRHIGGWMLSDVPGGRDALRQMVHPAMREVVDELQPNDAPSLVFGQHTNWLGGRIGFVSMYLRVRDDAGRFVGAVGLSKPDLPMQTLFLLTAQGDIGHFERMQQLATPGRRPAAILFADVEASTPLAKRLPTATYFTLVRRLTRAFDQCVVDAGGLVGRHAGDGVAAFFVAETTGSESAAACACITAARALQNAASEVATRHDLPADEVVVRAGLHWGTTLYIGSIVTTGRSEVTALGDEVNEAARIEACATGGRLLSSKGLLERLDPDDAAALGIDPDHLTYTLLADLDTATDKARRDAPAIPVHDIAIHTT
jgi:class 3 adenylate cyclase